MSAAQTDREQLLSWIDWLIDWLLIFFFFDFFSVSEEFTASRFYSLIFPFKNRGLLLGVEDFSFSGGASLMRIIFFFLAYAWVKERGINLSQGGNISIFLSGPQYEVRHCVDVRSHLSSALRWEVKCGNNVQLWADCELSQSCRNTLTPVHYCQGAFSARVHFSHAGVVRARKVIPLLYCV